MKRNVSFKNKKVLGLKQSKGFTLIELLVVIGILAVLLAITLVAINPAKQFQSANNTKRESDVNSLLNAINQYQVDNHGQLPASLTSVNCPSATPCAIQNGTNADVCAALTPTYLAALPQDPLSNNGAPITACASYNTGYTVSVSASDNRVTVYAPSAEGGATISVTR